MARGKINPRKRNIRDIIPIALIICEGSKTEINHLNNYKKRQGLRIIPKNLGDTDAPNIVKSAVKETERLGLDLKGRDTAWVVFDCNSNSEEQLLKARKLGEQNKIRLIYSNPCFEYWYLLHFTEWEKSIQNKELLTKLNNYIPDYNKSLNYYEILAPYYPEAKKRAFNQKTYWIEQGASLISRKTNPLTLVNELMEYILNNTSKR